MIAPLSSSPSNSLSNVSDSIDPDLEQMTTCQKVTVTAAAIILFPITLCYSLYLVRKPIFKFLRGGFGFLFLTLPKTFSTFALSPIFDALARVAKWTFTHIVEPIAEGIGAGLHYLFVTLPKHFYRIALKPLFSLLEKTCVWIYHNVLIPVGEAITAGLHFLFMTLPRTFFEHAILPFVTPVKGILQFLFITLPLTFHKYVLKPICGAIVSLARWTYTYLLTPLGHVLKGAGEFLFFTLPREFYTYVMRPFRGFVATMYPVIREGAHFLVVTLPKTFVKLVAAPLFAVTCTLAKALYTHILTPIGHCIAGSAQFLVDLAKMIGKLAVINGKALWYFVLSPCGRAIVYVGGKCLQAIQFTATQIVLGVSYLRQSMCTA